MVDSRVTTAFYFRCDFCCAGNAYLHSHGPTIRPYLVTRRCEKCHRVNQLGFLLGTIVEPENDSDDPGAGQLDLPMREES